MKISIGDYSDYERQIHLLKPVLYPYFNHSLSPVFTPAFWSFRFKSPIPSGTQHDGGICQLPEYL